MRAKSSICVLVSGGLDSDVLLAQLASRFKKVWPIYVRQGLLWEKAELYWLQRYLQRIRSLGQTQISKVRVFSLPMEDLYGRHWSTGSVRAPGQRSRDEAVYLPGRNMALSIKAAVFAAMNHIPMLALGSLDHNPFPDASFRFFRTWGIALGQGLGRPIRVIAPYRRFSKVQVIRRGKHLPLHLSFSCIAPKGKTHCGRCNKCAERRRAFKAAGVEDKTSYARHQSRFL